MGGPERNSKALPDVDALVLACPLTPETKLLIGAPEIAALKKGAVLVNIARGGVIESPRLSPRSRADA